MNRIILPLDNKSWDESLEIMKATTGKVWGYKLRRQILDHGMSVLSYAKKYGNIMVDFKLFDIPSAMTESLIAHINAGADITTIHCSSRYVPDEKVDASKIAGVTILTSMTDKDFAVTYNCNPENLQNKVSQMSMFADHKKYGYIVCSAKDLKGFSVLGVKKICPGIRPSWYQVDDDQNRTTTPKEAIDNGADLLVIGRPLLNDDYIVEAIERTNDEINGV